MLPSSLIPQILTMLSPTKQSLQNKLLDQVGLSYQCPLSWDQLEIKGANDLSRHCNQCQHQVHNLSEMSEAEASAFVEKAYTQGEKSGQRTCVFYLRDAHGKMVTRGCQNAERPISKNGKQLALATALGATLSAAACSKPSEPPTANPAQTPFPADRGHPEQPCILGIIALPPPTE